MTPEQLQELKEKAELWDSLSDSLKGIYASQFKYGTSTIQNISNASSHIGVLEEEQFEYVSIGEERVKLLIRPQEQEEGGEVIKVDCNYCGRVHSSTMCKLHPSPCKK